VYVGAGSIDSLIIKKDKVNTSKMSLLLSGSNTEAFVDERIEVG
jgi:hypothetical protein